MSKTNNFSLFGRILLLAVVIFIVLLQIFKEIRDPSFGAWGIFHYYLGAKYLKNIGYFSLYSCVLEVNKKKWDVKLVRDMHSYMLVQPQQLSKCQRNNFRDDQWKEFVRDTMFITSRAQKDYWAQAITDKGFNPPPFWAALVGSIAHVIPLNNVTYWLLFNIDFLLLLFAAVLVWWSAGITAGFITLSLSFFYFGTFGAIGNNFLQYGWYPLIVGTIVTWCMKKPKASGILLGFATGLQSFPGFFAIPVVFLLCVSWMQNRKKLNKMYEYFSLAFVATMLICAGVGTVY